MGVVESEQFLSLELDLLVDRIWHFYKFDHIIVDRLDDFSPAYAQWEGSTLSLVSK